MMMPRLYLFNYLVIVLIINQLHAQQVTPQNNKDTLVIKGLNQQAPLPARSAKNAKVTKATLAGAPNSDPKMVGSTSSSSNPSAVKDLSKRKASDNYEAKIGNPLKGIGDKMNTAVEKVKDGVKGAVKKVNSTIYPKLYPHSGGRDADENEELNKAIPYIILDNDDESNSIENKDENKSSEEKMNEFMSMTDGKVVTDDQQNVPSNVASLRQTMDEFRKSLEHHIPMMNSDSRGAMFSINSDVDLPKSASNEYPMQPKDTSSSLSDPSKYSNKAEEDMRASENKPLNDVTEKIPPSDAYGAAIDESDLGRTSAYLHQGNRQFRPHYPHRGGHYPPPPPFYNHGHRPGYYPPPPPIHGHGHLHGHTYGPGYDYTYHGHGQDYYPRSGLKNMNPASSLGRNAADYSNVGQYLTYNPYQQMYYWNPYVSQMLNNPLAKRSSSDASTQLNAENNYDRNTQSIQNSDLTEIIKNKRSSQSENEDMMNNVGDALQSLSKSAFQMVPNSDKNLKASNQPSTKELWDGMNGAWQSLSKTIVPNADTALKASRPPVNEHIWANLDDALQSAAKTASEVKLNSEKKLKASELMESGTKFMSKAFDSFTQLPQVMQISSDPNSKIFLSIKHNPEEKNLQDLQEKVSQQQFVQNNPLGPVLKSATHFVRHLENSDKENPVDPDKVINSVTDVASSVYDAITNTKSDGSKYISGFTDESGSAVKPIITFLGKMLSTTVKGGTIEKRDMYRHPYAQDYYSSMLPLGPYYNYGASLSGQRREPIYPQTQGSLYFYK